MINIGIIGVGVMGIGHCVGFDKLSDCKVLAIADPNEDQLNMVKKGFRKSTPETFTNHQDLLEAVSFYSWFRAPLEDSAPAFLFPGHQQIGGDAYRAEGSGDDADEQHNRKVLNRSSDKQQ